jgi:YidC/Oxa1 family membrane protein insertase
MQSLRYMVLGGEKPAPGEVPHNMTRVAWLRGGEFDEDASTSDLASGKDIGDKTTWVGVMTNYFLGAVSMSGNDARAGARYSSGVYQVSLGRDISLEGGKPALFDTAYYIGPKDAAALKAAPNSLSRSLDYGVFSIIAKPLVALLDFLNSYVHNYGMAIILMTILIKLVFWPLSQKSYKSMEQMKRLQPLMAKIREKYADDKETMNKEIMQLYKTYKVNPAGGCLPILVQIPVFFGLYQALLNAIELRQAPFITYLPFTDHIWLADLSARDPYLITPLVMGATMFLQQKLTPTPGDPTQAKVMMFMPLIFTVLFITFPSGLVLYWLVNNIISIGQQWWMLRRA